MGREEIGGRESTCPAVIAQAWGCVIAITGIFFFFNTWEGFFFPVSGIVLSLESCHS